MNRPTSRRTFLQSAASAAGLGVIGTRTRWARGATPARTVQGAPRQLLTEFDYDEVALTGGALKAQYDFIHAHYLALDNDRLLQVYREHADLPAPGIDMGGWYGADGFIPGHSFGQYVSGLARIGRCTGDAACRSKVHELVRGFGAALEANPVPYAGEGAWKMWPAYVLDKHMIGLIDAYRLSGMPQARTLIPRVLQGALPFISPISRDRIGVKNPPYDETYIVSENLFTAAHLTGERRVRDLAVKYLLDQPYFDPLARGENVLAGRQAYSHVMALSSAAMAYLELGEPRYREAIVNGWTFLGEQSFATGGWGPNELLIAPGSGGLYSSLTTTANHFETPCGTYATMKLARYLLRFTGDARYGDGLERIMWNGLLAVRPPDSNGNSPYYSSYNPGAKKVFYPQKWPCCSGTLVQGVADYVRNIYFHAPGALYVNLFTPSRVRWRTGGRAVTVTQDTDYPSGESVTLKIATSAPAAFALMVRIPGWLTVDAQLRINGRTVAVAAQPGTFAVLRRTWRDGDRLELHLPQRLRTEPIDRSHPETVALLRGPITYSALNFAGPATPVPRLHLPQLAPVTGMNATYRQSQAGREILFVPFYQVQNESYDVYFQQS
jgi:hypothetical protein